LRRYIPELEFSAVGIDPGGLLEDRIEARLGEMREGGLLEEVRALAGRMGRTAAAAVGYRELLAHLRGEVGLDEAFANAARSTRRLAKKQRTWFQRDPRIRWIPWLENRADRVERVMEVIG
jgi:tRNA dimethylallyltransferase